MPVKKIIWPAAYLVLLTIIIGLLIKQQNRNTLDTKWQTAIAARRNLDSAIVAQGIVKPMAGAEVKVGSRVSGIVKRLHVKIGDYVQKDSILAELDPSELQAVYEQWDAATQSSFADYEYATAVLERQLILREKKLISAQDSQIAVKAKIVAESDKKQADANLKSAKVRLEYTTILAPITGVVASISTQEGETVQASFLSPTFVTIVDLQRLEVWAYIDEADVGRAVRGQHAVFQTKTYPLIDFHCEVLVIHPKAVLQDNVVKYVCSIGGIDNQDQILKPEMTALVKIFVGARDNVISIPNKCIGWENTRSFVRILEKGLPVRRYITIGWKDENYTEIIAGLVEGETVIVDETK